MTSSLDIPRITLSYDEELFDSKHDLRTPARRRRHFSAHSGLLAKSDAEEAAHTLCYETKTNVKYHLFMIDN